SDLANNAPGYVEMSPSDNGIHAIGYGRHFQSLGNKNGVEAYATGRYFTFTGRTLRNGALTCIADWVAGPVLARHGGMRHAANAAESMHVDPKTVTELRSALNAIPADEYQVWVSMGCALHELGNVGRELWLTWSQSSDKWKPTDAKKWNAFKSDRTGYQAVFAEAPRHGWVNPARSAAQIAVAVDFGFKFAKKGDTAVEVTYLLDPWLPHRTVVGCWGRGEAGKSSWCAQMAAWASPVVSSLWITSEEPESHIRVRHTACGGEDRTLAVNVAVPTETDAKGKAIATSFNVFEHLEPAIEAFKRDSETRSDRPLGLIVLDAIVALTTWPKGANANDDEGVKKLIAFLLAVAERHNLTILILGHLNKKTTRDHIADAVTGAVAWTSSTRLSFMFVKDEFVEFQGFVRTVKKNTGQHYGASYETVPVHRVTARANGNDDWLCGVTMGETVWGEIELREAMADENDTFLDRIQQKKETEEILVDQTLNALNTGGETTRKEIEGLVSGPPGWVKVTRRHWQEADKSLANRGVQITNGPHNVRIYRRVDTNEQ
ncbi:MAG: PriCT-2 domain-containing protein, partial [Woeseia sp.]